MDFCLWIVVGLVEHSSNLALKCILPVVISLDTGSTPPNIAVILLTQAISPPNITVKPSTQGIGSLASHGVSA